MARAIHGEHIDAYSGATCGRYFPSCLSMKSAMMWLASMDSGKFELYQKA
jgi:hypothetical protein